MSLCPHSARKLLIAIIAAGCTTQACGFRDIYPDFTGSNFDVYCLSVDTPAAQAKWQTKVRMRYFPSRVPVLVSCFLSALQLSIYCSQTYSCLHLQKELPYPLLSDPKRLLIGALGAAKGGKTNRSHFIFEKGGKLIDKKNPVKPADR